MSGDGHGLTGQFVFYFGKNRWLCNTELTKALIYMGLLQNSTTYLQFLATVVYSANVDLFDMGVNHDRFKARGLDIGVNIARGTSSPDSQNS